MEKMHALVVKIDDNVDIMLGAFDGVYGFDAKVQQVCSKDQAMTDELVEVFGTLKISVQEIQCCSSDDLPRGLWESVFQYAELNTIKCLMGTKPETGCFAWRFSKKHVPTKTRKSY